MDPSPPFIGASFCDRRRGAQLHGAPAGGDANDFTSLHYFEGQHWVARFTASITLTATVTGVSVSTPTGKVHLYDRTTALAAKRPNPLGIVIYVNSSLSADKHTLTPAYQGEVYRPESSLMMMIAQTPTVTILSADATIRSRPARLPDQDHGSRWGSLLTGRSRS